MEELGVSLMTLTPMCSHRMETRTRARTKARTKTSSNKTIVGPKDDEFPDIAIMHQLMQELPENDTTAKNEAAIRNQKRFGRQVVHLCPAVLGEMKRNVSRTDEYKFLASKQKIANNSVIHKQLADAQVQMAQYLGTFFKRYPCLDKIVAFVMAGPYWRYLVFDRDTFSSLWDFERSSFKREREGSSVKSQNKYHQKYGKKFYELGTLKSDRALNELRRQCLQHLSEDE
ncbi:hypothetical protein BDP27DRAFT_75380 [Rhodocollybia butyracea]|uniref:Uncharacterized protein n=1 Tax=Rhodocollybia butyracea TaxID=206335 RepID=A0A9P5U402_9AGAR|nr:hypothetical protein BDP27DRAFT_75380 [Rhodocollybia butyracea]